MKGQKTKSSHKSPRGHGGKKHKRGKRHHGLRGFGELAVSHPKVSRAVNEGANFLSVIAGLAVGNLANKGLNMVVDKFIPMTEEQKSSDKFHWKKIIAPVGTFAIGAGATAVGHHLGAVEGEKHTIYGSSLKHLGYGIMGAGAVHAVKATLNKDILAGLSGASSNAGDTKFFQESADMLKKLVDGNKQFTPELDGSMGAENVMTTLRNEDTASIL